MEPQTGNVAASRATLAYAYVDAALACLREAERALSGVGAVEERRAITRARAQLAEVRHTLGITAGELVLR